MNKIAETFMAGVIVIFGVTGIVAFAYLLAALAMLFPAAILYFLLPYILPIFSISFVPTFFQCWIGCFILNLIAGFCKESKIHKRAGD